jgi:uncharacterized protein YbaR (Trm112 family)
MPVDAKLKELLVCPQCKGKLAETKGEKQVAEGLKCEACKLIYPVKDDIPVMLVDEAVRI